MSDETLDHRILASRIEADGDGMVSIPAAWFERCREAIEDAQDLAAAYTARREIDRGEGIPSDVMNAIHAGIHPLVAWRRYRRVSQAQLADAADLTQAAIARLEALEPGCGRLDTLDRLAAALEAPLWTLQGTEPVTPKQKMRRAISRQTQPRTERLLRASH